MRREEVWRCWGGVAGLLGALACGGDEPKAATKPEPPVIRIVQPIAVEAGQATRIRIRGQHFGTNAIELKTTELGDAPVGSPLLPTEAKAITGFEAGRVGDRVVEVNLTVAREAAPGTNATLRVLAGGIESTPFPLLVVAPGALVGEKEPNDGFKTAPRVPVPVRIRGAFEGKGDVDVFRIVGGAGTRIHAELLAARLGSTLDGMLTAYDPRMAVIGSVDDSVGRDPVLEFEVKEAGDHFIAVSYVNDQASPTHEYVLVLEEAKR